MLHVTRATWHGTPDTLHMTPDTWHATHGGRWTFSENVRSLALTVWVWRCFENLEKKDESVYQLIIVMTEVFVEDPRLHWSVNYSGYWNKVKDQNRQMLQSQHRTSSTPQLSPNWPNWPEGKEKWRQEKLAKEPNFPFPPGAQAEYSPHCDPKGQRAPLPEARLVPIGRGASNRPALTGQREETLRDS